MFCEIFQGLIKNSRTFPGVSKDFQGFKIFPGFPGPVQTLLVHPLFKPYLPSSALSIPLQHSTPPPPQPLINIGPLLFRPVHLFLNPYFPSLAVPSTLQYFPFSPLSSTLSINSSTLSYSFYPHFNSVLPSPALPFLLPFPAFNCPSLTPTLYYPPSSVPSTLSSSLQLCPSLSTPTSPL